MTGGAGGAQERQLSQTHQRPPVTPRPVNNPPGAAAHSGVAWFTLQSVHLLTPMHIGMMADAGTQWLAQSFLTKLKALFLLYQ